MVLLSVAGLVLSSVSARVWGYPALVAALVLLVLGAACAVWCFPAMKRARLPRTAHASVAVVLAATVYLAVNCGINLAMWHQTSAYRECVRDAVTLSSQSQCQESLYQDVTGGLAGH